MKKSKKKRVPDATRPRGPKKKRGPAATAAPSVERCTPVYGSCGLPAGHEGLHNAYAPPFGEPLNLLNPPHEPWPVLMAEHDIKDMVTAVNEYGLTVFATVDATLDKNGWVNASATFIAPRFKHKPLWVIEDYVRALSRKSKVVTRKRPKNA